MTSLCHCGQTSVIVSALASTLTTIGAPRMCVRRYHHEAGCWRTRYGDVGHTSRLSTRRSARARRCARYRGCGTWGARAARALQVSIEPIEEARSDVDLVGTSEEKMTLVGVNDELGLYAQPPQRVPVFVGLRDRHLRIAIAAYDQSRDRKSTRLNSSHLGISYAVFCLK